MRFQPKIGRGAYSIEDKEVEEAQFGVDSFEKEYDAVGDDYGDKEDVYY